MRENEAQRLDGRGQNGGLPLRLLYFSHAISSCAGLLLLACITLLLEALKEAQANYKTVVVLVVIVCFVV